MSEFCSCNDILERLRRALESDNRLRSPFLRPRSCDGLARIISYYLDEYFGASDIEYPMTEQCLRELCYILEKVRAQFCPECDDYLELCNYLCLYLSRIPRLYELERGIRELCTKIQHRTLQLRNRFDRMLVYHRYRNKIQVLQLPIFDYQRSYVRISEVLGLGSDEISRIRRYSDNFCLYEHQYRAITILRENKSRAIVVATPNASGKTEIAILSAIDLYRRGVKNALVLVVYPTRALARDQFSRWLEALQGYLQVRGVSTETRRTRVGKRDVEYALVSKDIGLVLLERELVQRRDVKGTIEEFRRSSSILIALTNPAFLLAITRGGKRTYRYYFGGRCVALTILDEIHFYKSRDLTLLVEVLRYLLREYGCLNVPRKVLILSATVGDLEGFCNQLRSALEGVGVEDVQYIIANFDRSR